MLRKFLIFCTMLAAVLFLTTACGDQSATPDALIISLAELSETPAFYDWDSDGTAMQVIARLDSDGVPHAAYNTCQVCVGSPYAYFELTNGWLICQNCGNAFTPDSVGMVSGGCNPLPVSEYEVSSDSLSIAAETLASVSPMFKNWKAIK